MDASRNLECVSSKTATSVPVVLILPIATLCGNPPIRQIVENLEVIGTIGWATVPELNPEPLGAHVLFVEDEVLIRTPVAQILRGAGFVVNEAANTDEAWSYLQTGAPVDLVFSDIQMPGSMDGVEFARKVREKYAHIVIVLSSGKGALLPRDNQHQFISKPYRAGDVVALVTSLLQQR